MEPKNYVPVWKTSSLSTAYNGGCVEVAVLSNGNHALRDTKDRSKPPHEFSQHEWDCFIGGVKLGEFD